MSQDSAFPPPSGQNHDELARALVAKDPAAARWAIARFSARVRRIVCRFASSPVDVEDAVQDVFLHFFRDVKHLRDPSAMEGFIMAIATRTARRSGRRARNRQARFLPLLSDRDHRSPVDVGAAHALRRLTGLLHLVRPTDRRAFMLRAIAGLRLREVADELGMSIPTVRRRCIRAHARITRLASRDLFLADYVRELHA